MDTIGRLSRQSMSCVKAYSRLSDLLNEMGPEQALEFGIDVDLARITVHEQSQRFRFWSFDCTSTNTGIMSSLNFQLKDNTAISDRLG